MKAKILVVCLIVVFLIGCNHPTEPLFKIPSPVFLDIPYLYAPGGQCLLGAAAMTASYVLGKPPTDKMILEQNIWLGSRSVNMTHMMPLFWEYWGLKRSRYRQYSFAELYNELEKGTALVVMIRGWKGMLHTVVLTGIDFEFVYVHDPSLGQLIYSHMEFDQLRAYGNYGVVVTRP